MLENIILGFLMSGEKTGYDLKQQMLKYTSNFYEASFGSIYPALKRLVEKQFVTSKDMVERGKAKSKYSITRLGKKELLAWLEEPLPSPKTNPDHLVKVFFYEYLPKEKVIENLKILKKDVNQYIRRFEPFKNKAQKSFGNYPDGFKSSTLIFGLNYYRMIIEWTDNLLEKLQK